MKASGDSVRILLVEDEAIIAADIEQALQRFGYEVVGIASDASDALRQAVSLVPDLVLMDIGLEGAMDGIDAASAIREQSGVPSVYLTGNADDATLSRAMNSEPLGYVIKPFHEAELRATIEVALHRHRLETDLRQRDAALVRYVNSVHNLSLTDELTGLYNRRGFLALAGQHLKVAERGHQAWVLLFMDVNGLKVVNDTRGHAAGDRLLQAMANVLRTTFRRSDILARLSGDEFVVLALETAQSGAEIAIRRFRQALAAHNETPAAEHPLSVSIGAAVHDSDTDESVEHLLARADSAMYQEKRLSGASVR